MLTLRGFILHLLFVLLLGSRTWQYPTIQKQGCGLPSSFVKARRGKRIVGGQPVYAGKWPWIATLMFNNSQYCAGSIVGRKWVVTTSHCFHGGLTSLDPKDWSVKVGKFSLKKNEWHQQNRTVKRIIYHPNYVSMWDTFKVDKPDDNDVALLELDQPVSYTHYVKPICLQDDQTNFLPGHQCIVAGWGHKSFGGYVQDLLHDVQVELVSRMKCNSPKSYNGSVHERAICAGYDIGGRDACQHDSGGPLACESAGMWYLVGQVSWGDKCALPHKYGVYSNMKLLSPWVVKTIAEN